MSQSTVTILQQWRFPLTFYHLFKWPPKLPRFIQLFKYRNVCRRFHCFCDWWLCWLYCCSHPKLKVLQQLHSWARLNCMSIHPIDTEIMFISKSSFIGPIPPITLDNHLINCTTQSSSLGVTLDNKLSWTPHIKSIAANFNAKTNKLKQIKSFDLRTLESIYFKGIQPSTTYCISLWGILDPRPLLGLRASVMRRREELWGRDCLWGCSSSLQVLEESRRNLISVLLILFIISAPLSQSIKFYLK